MKYLIIFIGLFLFANSNFNAKIAAGVSVDTIDKTSYMTLFEEAKLKFNFLYENYKLNIDEAIKHKTNENKLSSVYNETSLKLTKFNNLNVSYQIIYENEDNKKAIINYLDFFKNHLGVRWLYSYYSLDDKFSQKGGGVFVSFENEKRLFKLYLLTYYQDDFLNYKSDLKAGLKLNYKIDFFMHYVYNYDTKENLNTHFIDTSLTFKKAKNIYQAIGFIGKYKNNGVEFSTRNYSFYTKFIYKF